MDFTSQVEILDEAIYISLCTIVLGKGMYPYLLTTMGKIVGQIELCHLGRATHLGESLNSKHE